MYVHILLPTTITKKTLFDGLCIGVFTLKDVIFYKPQLPVPQIVLWSKNILLFTRQ